MEQSTPEPVDQPDWFDVQTRALRDAFRGVELTDRRQSLIHWLAQWEIDTVGTLVDMVEWARAAERRAVLDQYQWHPTVAGLVRALRVLGCEDPAQAEALLDVSLARLSSRERHETLSRFAAETTEGTDAAPNSDDPRRNR